MRWFFFFICSFQLFANDPFDQIAPSSPDEIFSLTADLLVDGVVSVVSGQISLSEVDLKVKGAQDLALRRIYAPFRILGRYHDKDEEDRLILMRRLFGQQLSKGWSFYPYLWAGYNQNSKYFQISDSRGAILEFQIEGDKGILKTASYGCTNLRGESPSSLVDIRNIELVYAGDWVKVAWPDGLTRHYLKCDFAKWRLEKEVLPNGKMIRYEYQGSSLSKILSSDPTGTFTYASIDVTGYNSFIGSDGRKANLVYANQTLKGGKKSKAKLEMSLAMKGENPIYSNKVGYDERMLLNFYDTKNYPFSCTYSRVKDEPPRVKNLSNPSGAFSFLYIPAVAGQKGGTTTVIHPDGVQTIYRFNHQLLLSMIENWFDGQLINKKIFAYDNKQHIKSIETSDGHGHLLLTKRFECDSAGNPILETIEGDFGTSSIRREFDHNRIVFEENDNGLQHAFTYLGSTWLITSKITLEFGRQLRKINYLYDHACNLIQVEEEGKTRVTYTVYQNAPHLHRIEWEEKRDWENQLIHKIHYNYDAWGNISREEHFGSDDHFAYKIEKTYNEKGELLRETNPLDQEATYQYDVRGRCFEEKPFSNGLTIRRKFDDKSRLILLEESEHKTEFAYNASDELTKKIDYLGFTTTYQYDPVHGKPNRIEEGTSVTQITYDAYGRPIETIDPANAKITKKYNSYGDVVQIAHPEGGKEFFTYYPDGLLKSHKNQDNLITFYTYDVFGRIKQKTIGQWTHLFEYDAYHLCQTIDPAGFSTSYKYDFVDRKIEENREGRITRFGYNPLGFLAWEERGNQRIDYTHDPLGQMLKKSINGLLETVWTYDSGGNITRIQQGGVKKFRHDIYNRCIEQIDEEGNQTFISYEKKPGTLIKKTIDPLGIETLQIYNSKDQLLKKLVSNQTVLEFEYDELFRLKKQDHIHFGYTQNGNQQSVQEAGLRTTNWTYTPGNLKSAKQKPDGTIICYDYNEQLLPTRIGSREFRYDSLGRLIGGTGFSRSLDPFGNIIKEEWSNGLWIETQYDDLDRPLVRTLPDQSRIEYQYTGPLLKKVSRLSPQGEELYSHTYDAFDSRGNPQIEEGLFQTLYTYDQKGRQISQQNPYFTETINYDALGRMIKRGSTTYTYDHLSQMTSESDRFTASYDVHYNLQELNGESIVTDSLNQIQNLSYDPNGNLIRPGFVYDEFDQLIEAEGEKMAYDALGRRIQKGNISFLYVGNEEIGAFEQRKATELKIPGIKEPIAIEIQGAPYAPIVDVQGVIRTLVDWKTKKVSKQNDCDVFATGLSDEIPYAYAGKRYDSNQGLLYFGKRYYDPSLRRWLTPDPIGPSNHSNLYQYLFNNPYLYQDNNGEFAFAIPLLFWGAELALPALSTCVTALVYGAATGAVVYGGYKAVELVNKITEVYVPDRPLPLTDDGIPIPETDAPHTELGTREGRKGSYPQAREFDKDGKPLRDIDFTDHGYPKKHPNPHQHRPKPNPTGGTSQRGQPEPVPEWNYS